jgi:hypothetical protein
MLLRPNPGTNKNQHKRFAQHIGSPRRGAPGRRRQKFLLFLYFVADLAGHVSMVNGIFHVNGVANAGKIGTHRIRRLIVLPGLDHIAVLA